jgi:hypothetical protein
MSRFVQYHSTRIQTVPGFILHPRYSHAERNGVAAGAGYGGDAVVPWPAVRAAGRHRPPGATGARHPDAALGLEQRDLAARRLGERGGLRLGPLSLLRWPRCYIS